MISKVLNFQEKPWIWAFLGSLILWVAIGITSSNFSVGSLVANANLACILAIISLGQMFAISLGEGSIDLSIPYVVTLTAFLSMGIINGQNSNILIGLLVSLGVGLLVGIVNTISITLFRIPPIIATMALGFILNTAIFLYAARFKAFTSSPLLAVMAKGSIFGIPWIIVISVIFAGLIGFIISQTSYGRALMATGQNRTAANFAGINVNRTILSAYLLSGTLAALGGVLIAARVGGAFLDMGQPFLLQSVGVVVIGGTLVSGGKATVIGTMFGSLFMILLSTFMSVTHLPIGAQNIIEGILIILILAVSMPKTMDRI